MKLEEIIKGITVSEIIGNTTKEISGINIDSRLIEPEHRQDTQELLKKLLEREKPETP